MLSDDKIPQSLVNLVGNLYRFIAGAFGQDLRRPMTVNFCPYFWAVFFTFVVPAGLPFVLLGWTLRLTLGKGRGAAVMNVLGNAVSALFKSAAGKWIGIIVLLSVLGLISWILFKNGKLIRFLITFGAGLGAIIGSTVLLAATLATAEKIQKRMRSKRMPTLAIKRKLNKLLQIGRTIFWPIKVIAFFFLMIAVAVDWAIVQPLTKGYKAACPLVTFE